MDKVSAPKDRERDKMKFTFRVQDGIGNLIVENSGRHAVHAGRRASSQSVEEH